MTQSKQSKPKSRFWHWVQVVVMFLSFGMIFPNAMMEDGDLAEHGTEKDAKVTKQ